MANLIRAQTLDVSILEAGDVPPLMASTQTVGETVVGAAAGGRGTGGAAAATGTAAAAASVWDEDEGEEESDLRPGDAADIGAAGVAAAAAASAAVGAAGAAAAVATGPPAGPVAAAAATAAAAHPHKTPTTAVCPYLWRRMLCRRADCEYSHPDLCAASTCVPTRAPNCAKFHGRYKEDKGVSGPTAAAKRQGNKTKKSMNVTKKRIQEPAQGNGRRGALPPNHTSSARSNNRRFPPTSAPPRGPQPTESHLDKSRRELAEVKRELATIRKLGLAPNAAHLAAMPPMGSKYSDVASARALPLSSFAAVFATALESALGSAGLRLASA